MGERSRALEVEELIKRLNDSNDDYTAGHDDGKGE